MLKAIAVAGLLATAAAAQPAAASLDDDPAAPATASNAPDYHCFDTSEGGLSGSLQIDSRTRAANPLEIGPEAERGPPMTDCALV